MKKILIASFLFLLLLLSKSTVEINALDFVENGKSGILIEESTGEVLFEKNSHDKLIPASMTKIMTMILIAEQIENRVITLDQKVTVSKHAASMGGSQVYLTEGEVMSVDDLLKCIAISSANDAAVAMAEFTYGSEKLFVDAMNNKVKELNLKNTLFQDCTGLSDENHYSSSYDMAMMSKYLINNFSFLLNYTSIYDDYIRKDSEKPFWLVTTNKLIDKVEGVDGLKTGYLSSGGFCLTATMLKDGMRLISVVMGYETSLKRNVETVELLNYGFSTYEKCNILPKGTIVKELNNLLFKPNVFKITLDEDIFILKKKNESVKDITYEVIYDEDHNNQPKIIVYYDNNELLKTSGSYSEVIKKRNFFEIMIMLFQKMIN